VAIDGAAADRVTGRILALDSAPRALRAPLPLLEASATGTGGPNVR
jgi:hypothetical protein